MATDDDNDDNDDYDDYDDNDDNGDNDNNDDNDDNDDNDVNDVNDDEVFFGQKRRLHYEDNTYFSYSKAVTRNDGQNSYQVL